MEITTNVSMAPTGAATRSGLPCARLEERTAPAGFAPATGFVAAHATHGVRPRLSAVNE